MSKLYFYLVVIILNYNFCVNAAECDNIQEYIARKAQTITQIVVQGGEKTDVSKATIEKAALFVEESYFIKGSISLVFIDFPRLKTVSLKDIVPYTLVLLYASNWATRPYAAMTITCLKLSGISQDIADSVCNFLDIRTFPQLSHLEIVDSTEVEDVVLPRAISLLPLETVFLDNTSISVINPSWWHRRLDFTVYRTPLASIIHQVITRSIAMPDWLSNIEISPAKEEDGDLYVVLKPKTHGSHSITMFYQESSDSYT